MSVVHGERFFTYRQVCIVVIHESDVGCEIFFLDNRDVWILESYRRHVIALNRDFDQVLLFCSAQLSYEFCCNHSAAILLCTYPKSWNTNNTFDVSVEFVVSGRTLH